MSESFLSLLFFSGLFLPQTDIFKVSVKPARLPPFLLFFSSLEVGSCPRLFSEKIWNPFLPPEFRFRSSPRFRVDVMAPFSSPFENAFFFTPKITATSYSPPPPAKIWRRGILLPRSVFLLRVLSLGLLKRSKKKKSLFFLSPTRRNLSSSPFLIKLFFLSPLGWRE